jgi:hypothetical protein
MFHQRKGGIHDIYSIFMETFGRYRLTGLLHQNICGAKSAKQPPGKPGGFLLRELVLIG